jgi:hypothetical protein
MQHVLQPTALVAALTLAFLVGGGAVAAVTLAVRLDNAAHMLLNTIAHPLRRAMMTPYMLARFATITAALSAVLLNPDRQAALTAVFNGLNQHAAQTYAVAVRNTLTATLQRLPAEQHAAFHDDLYTTGMWHLLPPLPGHTNHTTHVTDDMCQDRLLAMGLPTNWKLLTNGRRNCLLSSWQTATSDLLGRMKACAICGYTTLGNVDSMHTHLLPDSCYMPDAALPGGRRPVPPASLVFPHLEPVSMLLPCR